MDVTGNQEDKNTCKACTCDVQKNLNTSRNNHTQIRAQGVEEFFEKDNNDRPGGQL